MSDVADKQVIPQPLTPADCTVSGFGYMPLDVDRLRSSRAWLICKRRPELFFYMHNLWTTAWKETPAASLEDDDDWLADKACCSFDLWPRIREDVLRGFVMCSDGRLYHELISVKALEAWLERLGARVSSGHGNAKRYGTKFDDKHLREQLRLAQAMLFALDPNSGYFTKRSAALVALQGQKAARPRREKPAKSAPDNGNSGSPDGNQLGLPVGEDQESHGIARNATQLNATQPYVGGKPPTTPSADAPWDEVEVEGSHVGSEEQAARAALVTRGTPATAIPMADKALVLPDWLGPFATQWAAFEQIRWKKNTKAPYTLEAQKGILRKLKQFYDEGQDLGEVLEASVNAGWTSVFAQRGAMSRANPAAASRYAQAASSIFGSGNDNRGVILDA